MSKDAWSHARPYRRRRRAPADAHPACQAAHASATAEADVGLAPFSAEISNRARLMTSLCSGKTRMARRTWLTAAGVTLLFWIVHPRDARAQELLSFLDTYCIDCHYREAPEAGIALDRFESADAFLNSGKELLRVLDVVQSGIMPPADASQPQLEERTQFSRRIIDQLMNSPPDPADLPGVVMRRLNRQEYDNTVADLIGTRLDLAKDFPADDIGFGYDNVGSALNLSPIHMERYLGAAEVALETAIVTPNPDALPPVELIGLRTYPLPVTGSVEFEHPLAPGRYMADFSLVRAGVHESVEPPRLVIGFGSDRRTVRAARIQDETVVYRLFLRVHDGDSRVYVAIADQDREIAQNGVDTAGENVSGDKRYGNQRGYHVDSMVVRGPVAMDDLPASHRWLVFCAPDRKHSRSECGRKIITQFANRAFRRPAREDEIDRLMHLFELATEQGESFERATQLALTAVLVSPQFLFLVEPEDSEPDRPLTEYELATRLSYFLWSSMPDDALMHAAAEQTLRKNLRQHVSRMLSDPRSSAFVENFSGQWLQLRNLEGVAPDPELYPQFDGELADAMRKETEHFFAYVLRENRNVLEFLDADYTFVNQRLAKHYDIDGVSGDQFRRVSLSDGNRGGVLTQASVLTLTSHHNRTSPVKRGQWILQQLLGTPPPPPPPDVAQLDESPEAAKSASLRERLELHRSSPECASCHNQMDPLGFGLENFDAIGAWRTMDGDFPIDASGILPGRFEFSGVGELKELLTSSAKRRFSWCLIENLLTYGLGRSLQPSDYVRVEAIRQRLAENDYRMQEILFAIVESDMFQRRGASN